MTKHGLWAVCTVLSFAALLLVKPVKAADFVYASTQNGTIHQFAGRSDGSLAPLVPPTVRVAPANQTVTLALHPTRPFVYAAVADHKTYKGTIFTYRIQENGTLTSVAATPMYPAGFISKMTADPQGRFFVYSCWQCRENLPPFAKRALNGFAKQFYQRHNEFLQR